MPAALNPALPTNDLRSGAKSYRRDKSHNAKWAKGATTRSGQKCPHNDPWDSGCICAQCHVKPIIYTWEHNGAAMKQKKFAKKSLNAQASTVARKAFRKEVVDAMDGPLANASDPSSDEEVQDASAAPLPVEADFMYSYDAKSGPQHGSGVLSHAITTAVQRFENTETEKLVRKEYDVIDEAKEGSTTDEDEDDFEMIEHANLK